MRIILVRHYKTTSNETGKIMGWGDAPPAKNWQEDSNHVAQVLLKAHLSAQIIYTSSLTRAINTGKFYADILGIKQLQDTPALNEVNYGKLCNKSKKWVEKFVLGHKKDPALVYPDGESFNQMKSRCIAFVESISEKHADDTVLIVVHAGIIRCLISHFLKLDYTNNLQRKIGHRYIGDFTIKGKDCIRYNELGKESGFITEGIIKLQADKKSLTAA
jgi:broad specificity phosphatase PhoE